MNSVEKLKRKSIPPSLANLSSPSERRTSSEYHKKCIPNTYVISGDVSPARHDEIRPVPVKSPGRRKSSPLSASKSLTSLKLDSVNSSLTTVIDQVDGIKSIPAKEIKLADSTNTIEDNVCHIFEVPKLSGSKPLINETTAHKENSSSTSTISSSVLTTPQIPRKEVTKSSNRTRRANLLLEMAKLFDNVSVDPFIEDFQDESLDELSIREQLKPLEEEEKITERSSEPPPTEVTLLQFMSETWKTLLYAQAKRDKLYEMKCSIGTRIVQFCDDIYRGLDSLTSSNANFKAMVQLFLSLSNLRELSRCWLVSYPTDSASLYEKTLTRLLSSCEEAVNELQNSETKARTAAQKAVEKLVFLIGRRLPEINVTIEDSLWSILVETVQDNLAKGSSTQFSVTLHTLIDQISKSQMNVSSMTHQAFVNKKTESIQSLLETSIELLDSLQQVMRKFKIWHEFHNGENTITKMYDLQFSWHAENYQYLKLIISLVIDYTKNITKVIEEPGSITELPMLDKLLRCIENNLKGIQRSLPFSHDSEVEGEEPAESVKLLNDLEQSIRQSISITKKQEMSTQSDDMEMLFDDGNNNRRVHFSDSLNEPTQNGDGTSNELKVN